MKNHQQSWQRLAAAARAHCEPRDEAAPYGFASRVACRAFVTPPSGSWSLLEYFALRGLIAACTLGLAATAYGVVNTSSEEADLAVGDVVGEILDLT